jgi:hypothetical protein
VTKYSENNSQFSGFWLSVRFSTSIREAIPRRCRRIPCATEQASQFTGTGKKFAKISEFAELEQAISEFGLRRHAA